MLPAGVCGAGVCIAGPNLLGVAPEAVSADLERGLVRKEVKMLKRSLIAIAVVAMLATVAGAGTIKTHEWPCQFVPVELMSIPVTLDVGFFVRVPDQNKTIKLNQTTGSATTFEGCVDFDIITNFELDLSCTITPNGTVSAESWSCFFAAGESHVGIGTTTGITVCARATNLDMTALPAQSANVTVATVKISVIPAS
jgi:hypothetical protein